jgi:fructokinase
MIQKFTPGELNMLFGGIEAGGTKFVCAIASGPNDIRDSMDFPTTTPQETLNKVVDFFKKTRAKHSPLAGIGVASFGPIDLRLNSPSYGRITKTPKSGWSGVDVVGTIQRNFNLPIGFDTDVNGAALAELHWGAAQTLDTFLYLTIGTGIGGGGMVGGKLMHGLVHPEMGHVRLPHNWEVDPFPGICPYHGDCLEGMASGPALEKRWGKSASDLPSDHEAWKLEVDYLSFGLVNFICTISPQRLILGGGVMKQKQLFPMLRNRVLDLLNNYVQDEHILNDIDHYIVPPALGSNAGVMGAIALAKEAAGG